MRAEYGFSKLKGRRNPYAKALKKQVTIRLGSDVIAYFKSMAGKVGVPYQSLINIYLRDCAEHHRKLTWAA
ncbi:MAG: BrnA antitoxin family protein [Elusimicrobia bacterium]|nr:BrnA antitoxin family protein [Elusimicrobiota bacterium]